MRAIGAAAMEYVIDFLQQRPSAPATNHAEAFTIAATLREPPEEIGRSFEEALGKIDLGVQHAYDPTNPGYLAYIPGGGLFASAVADLIADVTNRFVNLGTPAPGLVQLESNVVRWMCDEFDLPGGSQGVLTSGGSMANFSAIVTARHSLLGEDLRSARFYGSEHLHHSNLKAAKLAGLATDAFQAIPCDDQLRMDTGALQTQIKADRERGLRPFLVIGNAGTVNTGAVDPLEEIARVCRDEGVWFHVDGAYGGFFQLTEPGRARLKGITSADSITLDPHKGMFLPYGTGALLVRNRAKLEAAHRVEAGYLPPPSTAADLPDFADLSPELSRDFRGLRVWLPLALHGAAAFRDALSEKLELARVLNDALVGNDLLEVPWAPQLSIVAFRPNGEDDDATTRLLEAINASKRVFISSTFIDGRQYLRACVMSHRTHRDRIDEAIEIIEKAVANL